MGATSLPDHSQPVYTYPVTAYSVGMHVHTAYSVGMHVQSDLHEAVLAPLRHPSSSAVSWGNQWLICTRRPRLLRVVAATRHLLFPGGSPGGKPPMRFRASI